MEPVFIPAWPDAAKSLCIGRTKIWELMLTGELPSVMDGKKRAVPVDELRKYAKNRVAEAAQAA